MNWLNEKPAKCLNAQTIPARDIAWPPFRHLLLQLSLYLLLQFQYVCCDWSGVWKLICLQQKSVRSHCVNTSRSRVVGGSHQNVTKRDGVGGLSWTWSHTYNKFEVWIFQHLLPDKFNLLLKIYWKFNSQRRNGSSFIHSLQAFI